MIYVRLSGGLGNQMFQYAYARALVARGRDVRLDTHWYRTAEAQAQGRELGLGAFDIAVPFRDSSRLKRLRWRLTGRALSRPSVGYYPEALSAKDGTYAVGTWFDERYFSDIADTIRRDLKLKAPLSAEAQRYADMIAAAGSASVSLHVRRGDYVSGTKTAAFSNICTPDYYERAIALLREKVRGTSHGGVNGATGNGLKIFLFSDDIEWVRANIHAEGAVAVSPQVAATEEQPAISIQEEVMLMSMCRHHIVANSSFSWWGAWLGESAGNAPGAITVAPRIWMADRDGDSIAPERWVRI